MTGNFTLDDLRRKLDQLEALGWMKEDQHALEQVRGMIAAMTPEERSDPDVIDAARMLQIATTSGVHPHEVQDLLKHFHNTRQLMRRLGDETRGV